MIQHEGDTLLTEEELRDNIKTWYGRKPSVQTIRSWVQSDKLTPIAGGSIDSWDGHHRKALYSLREVNQLAALYKRSQGYDLTVDQFHEAVNKQARNEHSIGRIRQMLVDGDIPSWRDPFKAKNPYRIAAQHVIPIARLLDSEVVPVEQRRRQFNVLYTRLQQIMSKTDIARATGYSASYWSQCEHDPDRVPSEKALKALVELSKQ